MRPLVFRAWDGIREKWLHNYNEYGGCGITGEIIFTGCWLQDISVGELDGLVVEQYTGLKDMNGVMIYEGDKVIHKHYPLDIGIVSFSDGSFICGSVSLSCYHESTIEVVGNIHEEC